MQQHNNQWKAVAYASCNLTETGRQYTQIEKEEALALTWACAKFSSYIIGKTIELESDHKPLLPLLCSKDLEIMFKLMWYSFRICHVATTWQYLYTADVLSRSPCYPNLMTMKLKN